MEGEIASAAGPSRYSLQVPALSERDHARLQAVLLRGAAQRPDWRRRLGGLAAGSLVGAAAGFLAAHWDIAAELWITSGRTGGVWSLEGPGILLAVLAVVLATMLALTVILTSRQRRAMQSLHAAGGELYGPHELVLGEHGLLWRNPTRTLLVPWSRLTGAVRTGGLLLLIADRISAFWLPEALIASHPDRAGLEALLRQHTQLP
ncbi:hypothetical protein [Roseomonas sp. WA12]